MHFHLNHGMLIAGYYGCKPMNISVAIAMPVYNEARPGAHGDAWL
jgi:hypothetical protein